MQTKFPRNRHHHFVRVAEPLRFKLIRKHQRYNTSVFLEPLLSSLQGSVSYSSCRIMLLVAVALDGAKTSPEDNPITNSKPKIGSRSFWAFFFRTTFPSLQFNRPTLQSSPVKGSMHAPRTLIGHYGCSSGRVEVTKLQGLAPGPVPHVSAGTRGSPPATVAYGTPGCNMASDLRRPSGKISLLRDKTAYHRSCEWSSEVKLRGACSKNDVYDAKNKMNFK